MNFRDLIFLSSQEHERLSQTFNSACERWSKRWLSHCEEKVSSRIVNHFNEDSSFSKLNWNLTSLGNLSTYSTQANGNKASTLSSLLLPALDVSKVEGNGNTELEAVALGELIKEAINADFSFKDEGAANSKPLTKDDLFGQCIWEVMVGEYQFCLLIPDAIVRELSQRKTTKGQALSVDLDKLVADKTVNVRIKLEKFSSALGQLRDLKVGDILETGVALDAPLNLVTESDEALAQCYIGKQASQKAIVLSGK